MKTTTLSLGLALPLVLAFAQPLDSLRRGVAADTTLEKRFSTQVEMSLEDMTMVQNGQEIDSSMLGMELTISNGATYGWTDTYAAARDNGAPSRLTREFTTLENSTSTSQSSMMGSQDLAIGSSSELDGETVIFVWDADEEAYVASFPEESGADEALLKGLEALDDLAFLLPSGDVEVDAEWEADPQALIQLLGPGGDLKLLPNEDDLPEEARGQAPGSEFQMSEMLGEVEGSVTCTYLGTREEGGRAVAVIKVEIDITSASDMTEKMREELEGFDPGDGAPDIEFESVDTELSIDGEGELLWDMAAGHMVSFQFSGEMGQVMDMAMSMSMGGQTMEIEQSMGMAGSVEFDFTVAPE